MLSRFCRTAGQTGLPLHPAPDAGARRSEFRQLYRDGVTRTLDGRPAATSNAKEAPRLIQLFAFAVEGDLAGEVGRGSGRLQLFIEEDFLHREVAPVVNTVGFMVGRDSATFYRGTAK